MTDSLSTTILSGGYIDSLLQNTAEISRHTEPTIWEKCVLENFLNISSVIAAIVTIVMLVSLWTEYKKTRTSAECQKHIIQDLIRHLYVNNVLAMALVMKMSEKGYSSSYPEEGLLRRFCVLPGDLDFGRFTITAKNYDNIHNIELKLRNYNIAAEVAGLHLANQNIGQSIKEDDIRNLISRAIHLTDNLLNLGSRLRLKMDSLEEIIIHRYSEEIDACSHSNPDKNMDVRIMSWFGDAIDYYDKAGLADFTVRFVRYRYKDIYLIDF